MSDYDLDRFHQAVAASKVGPSTSSSWSQKTADQIVSDLKDLGEIIRKSPSPKITGIAVQTPDGEVVIPICKNR